MTDHVLKSQQLVTNVIDGHAKNTERNANEKKEVVKKIFLDFTTKMKSPELILPLDEPVNLADIAARLKKVCTKITDATLHFHLTRNLYIFFAARTG